MNYKIEVKVGSWSGNSVVLATRAEAEAYGRDMLSRWTLPTEFRVIETNEPANYLFAVGQGLVELPEAVPPECPACGGEGRLMGTLGNRQHFNCRQVRFGILPGAVMSKPFYRVIPRYTAGSPGLVDKETALRVAAQEVAAMNSCLMGLYGRDKTIDAVRLGLHGIVEERTERKNGWDVRDVITGQLRRIQDIKAKDVQIGDIVTSRSTGNTVTPASVLVLKKDRKVYLKNDAGYLYIFGRDELVTVVRVVKTEE